MPLMPLITVQSSAVGIFRFCIPPFGFHDLPPFHCPILHDRKNQPFCGLKKLRPLPDSSGRAQFMLTFGFYAQAFQLQPDMRVSENLVGDSPESLSPSNTPSKLTKS